MLENIVQKCTYVNQPSTLLSITFIYHISTSTLILVCPMHVHLQVLLNEYLSTGTKYK